MSVELCDSDDDVVATADAPAPQKPSAPAPAKASAAPAKAEKKRSREAAPPLPYGWIRKESKSKKGAYYYANILTGKTQVERPGPKIARSRPAGKEPEVAKPLATEVVQQRQAEYEAAEAELEAAKRQAAERRAAQKAMVDDAHAESAEENGSEEDAVTGEDFAKWKAQEEQREKREVQLKNWPASSELPPVPVVSEPVLDVLKDDKWVDRFALVGSQRWTLGRAVGEVDVVMNHPSVSRQHAALSRGSAGIYLTDLNSQHGVFVQGQRIEKNFRVLLKNGDGIRFGTSTRLYYYHEPRTERSSE